MTDRHSTLTVALARDTRPEDLEELITAISLLRGVVGVTPGKPVSPIDFVERRRVRHEISDRIYKQILGES